MEKDFFDIDLGDNLNDYDFEGESETTDIFSVYINEARRHPLLTVEEEKKYGNYLKLKNKINITTKKKYLNKKVDVIDLEAVLVSLYNHPNASDILNTLLRYYYDKESGINSIVNKYLFLYKDLYDKMGKAPNEQELNDYFNKAMPNGIFNDFNKNKVLDKKVLLEQVSYFIKYYNAFDKFVNCNLRLVIGIARRFKSNNLDLLDLVNEGNLGLIRAVEKFDVDRDIKFSTYATWWIKQAISRCIYDKGYTIRIPAYLYGEYNAYKKNVVELQNKYGRKLTMKEISDALDIPIDKIKEYQNVPNQINMTSLDRPVNKDDEVSTMIDFIANDQDTPEELFYKESLKEEFRDVLSILTDREKEIISLRFGMNDENKAYTLAEIGKMMKVTRERIRQVEAKALKKIQTKARFNKKYKELEEYLNN